jgi:hypothetical protein
MLDISELASLQITNSTTRCLANESERLYFVVFLSLLEYCSAGFENVNAHLL